METKCKLASAFDHKCSGMEEHLDMDHIRDCAECSQLLDGHRKLARAFQGTQRNAPSIHFNRDLRTRLRDEDKYEQSVRRSTRFRAVTMWAYCLLATIASIVTLSIIPWSSEALPAPVVWTIGTIISVVAVVPLMIYRNSLEISDKTLG